MADAAQSIIPTITPVRAFEGHEGIVCAVAVFPDRQRMVTGSKDNTLRLWDLNDGIVLKKMEGHRSWVQGMAVSRDGQLIVSGDLNGQLIAWHGETGKCRLRRPIQAHEQWISWMDLSPDGAMLATGSRDKTMKLWNTQTWQLQGDPIICGGEVFCVRYSPFGGLLAIATSRDIQILNARTRICIANFEAHAVISSKSRNVSLVWTPDSTRLLSGGDFEDPTIREWDTSTWKQVGDPWTGHTGLIYAIAVNSNGTLIASASHDNHVRLWRLADRQTIAIFKHANYVCRVIFSVDGKHILSGGKDKQISKWAVPEDVLVDSKLFTITTATRKACINGDLKTAEALLTRAIDHDTNNYISYANRSFVMARKLDWDRAFEDAIISVRIQPSLTGYISKGIALCGKKQIQAAMKAFDLAFMFTNGDLKIAHLLLLIKAIALFIANEHKDALLRVQELAAVCPSADTLACHVVETYLRVQLGINALDGARHDEAADHFTAAVNTNAFSSKLDIHSIYEDFVVLFGWDLKSLWKTANKNRCEALLWAGRLGEAHESYRYMMDMSDEITKASCRDWSTAFKQECCMLDAAKGDAALAESNYESAIEQYSAAIELDSTADTIFANRSKARLEKTLWEDALLDAQKVIELNPLSYLGYQLKHAALHGAKRYDEAIEACQVMFSKLHDAPETQMLELRQQYVSQPDAEHAIRKAIHIQLDDAPPRLFHTSTRRLCNREAQINTFKTSIEYKELLSLIMTHADHRRERIQNVVMTYFRCVMLSHRWEETELRLQKVQGRAVDELDPVGGAVKLQSFCTTVHAAGYRWGWIDTCCIDQSDNVELQKSLNSMFVWYHRSALTMVYLSDVPPSSKSGALAKSAWNTRGWTVPEFLAPKVILFYQKDWTLYLDDRSPNHKESVTIMQELEDATGIDARTLVAFRPGMKDARQKIKWASTRVTTVQEDIAYSLFGIFGIHLPVLYGEKKQNALGRLLQEIVAQSGDITALNWVGRPSEFNSCLPAEITSYEAPPYTCPSLSEDELHASVSSLRDTGAVQLASKLYSMLESLAAPRFAHRRLHLPCIVFTVPEIRRRRHQDPEETCVTYEVKANGLHDLLITTEDKLFSRTKPARQFLLVHPWDHCLLELPDYLDDMQSVYEWTPPGSPIHDTFSESSGEQGAVDSELGERALRLLVRLGQPFSAFLLAQQSRGEYKRIASDHDIIAHVKDMASVHDLMDVRILDIL